MVGKVRRLHHRSSNRREGNTRPPPEDQVAAPPQLAFCSRGKLARLPKSAAPLILPGLSSRHHMMEVRHTLHVLYYSFIALDLGDQKYNQDSESQDMVIIWMSAE